MFKSGIDVSDSRAVHLSGLAVCLAVGTYLIFSLVYLDLPGLQYDEVLFTNASLGNIDGSFLRSKIQLFGRTIPLMLMSYIGAPKAWLYAFVFHFFGCSPITVRIPVVILGLITLGATYGFVRRLFGYKVAVWTLLLLAADPTFIFANSRDWGPVALSMVLKCSVLYFLWRWLEEGKAWCAVAAAFLMGLGVYDKVIFLWFAVGVIIALVACYRARVAQLLDRMTTKLACGAFISGCLPMLIFGIRHFPSLFHDRIVLSDIVGFRSPEKFRLLRETLDGSAVYSVMNLIHPDRAAEFHRYPAIGFFDTALKSLSGLIPPGGDFLPAGLALALLFFVGLRFGHRLADGRKVLFCLIPILVIAGFIFAVNQAAGPHHAIMIYPFPHILAASAIHEASQQAATMRARLPRLLARAAVPLLAAALVLSQCALDSRYLWTFRVSGGAGMWSDAIYELAQHTNEHPDRNFLLMDWGFNTQLLLLSNGRIRKREVIHELTGLTEQKKIQRLREYLAKNDTTLVFHSVPFETYPHIEWFRQAQQERLIRARLVKTFYQRDGRAAYLLYEP